MPLDPDVQELLRRNAASGAPPLHELTPAAAREAFAAFSVRLAGPGHPDPTTRDLAVPTPDGERRARLYRPPGSEPDGPIVLYAHGGGFTVGSIESHDALCRDLAAASGAVLVSLDYRLAPEHPYPAALDDVEAALRWLAGGGVEDVDPARVVVAGDSAGGNLVAAACLRIRDGGGPLPRGQVLLYPCLDLTCSSPSYDTFASGCWLEAETMRWFVAGYIGEADRRTPEASPLHAPDLSGLPPAQVITVEHDPLRDEGRLYAERLAAAGVPTRHRCLPGLVHGAAGLQLVVGRAAEVVAETAAALRRLAGPPA